MLQIESEWDDITAAIRTTVILLASFGFYRETLTSNTAIIPIAFYIKKINSPNNFSESSKFNKDRKNIFKWLVTALLKQTFSGQSDNVLRSLREIINKNNSQFPIDEIFTKLKGSSKSMIFDDDEISNLLYHKYGSPYTYSTLTLIYPSLDFRNKFHQDHIFPKKLFTPKRLAERKIPKNKIETYIDSYDYIGNIQLLEGIPNQEKSGKDFSQWILETYQDCDERKDYMRRHYIPDVNLSLENFLEFLEEREKLITSALAKVLQIKN